MKLVIISHAISRCNCWACTTEYKLQPRQINVIPGADVDDAGGKSAGHLVVTSDKFIKICTNTKAASKEDSLFLHGLWGCSRTSEVNSYTLRTPTGPTWPWLTTRGGCGPTSSTPPPWRRYRCAGNDMGSCRRMQEICMSVILHSKGLKILICKYCVELRK